MPIQFKDTVEHIVKYKPITTKLNEYELQLNRNISKNE